MASDPEIGVIMTAFNSGPFIVEALESLIAQTQADWECVVVDDGSADGTVSLVKALARSDDRISLIRSTHGGVSAARNAGLAALPDSIRYVAFLDSDDTYLPGALTALVKVLDNRADAVGVYGMAEYMDAEGRAIDLGQHPATQRSRRRIRGHSMIDVPPGDDSTFADISVAGAIWPSAVGLHRRSVIDNVGQFDVSFTRQGDWELYLRMSRRGPFAVLDQQVAWYRRHGNNLTSSANESVYHQERARHKAFHSAANTLAQQEIIARGGRRLRLADFKRAAERARTDLSAHRLGPAAVEARSALLLASTLIRQRPPRPSRRRVRWTRPDQKAPRGDG